MLKKIGRKLLSVLLFTGVFTIAGCGNTPVGGGGTILNGGKSLKKNWEVGLMQMHLLLIQQ